MKAQNLTISVPSPDGCNKKCPYCVSDMTGYVKPNWELMRSKFEKVKTLAKSSQVNNVLITSKGEPLMNSEHLYMIAKHFNEFPLEIQTNGILLNNSAGYEWYKGYRENHLECLKRHKVDVIAISIDKESEFEDRREAIEKAVSMGFVVRLCINVNKFLNKYHDIAEVFAYAGNTGTHQLLWRNLTTPEGMSNDWIEKYAAPYWEDWDDVKNPNGIGGIKKQLDRFVYDNKLKPIRTLITGEKLYEIDEVGFTIGEYCIQERSEGDNDIRSLIFLEDGHVYTSWNSRSPMF